MKYTIDEFMSRLCEAERRRQRDGSGTPAPDPRIAELDRENARLRRFVADLLLGKSA